MVNVITPCYCASGKVIGSDVVVFIVVVDTKARQLSTSKHLRYLYEPRFIWKSRKPGSSFLRIASLQLVFGAIAVKEVLFVVGHFASVHFILLYNASMLSIYMLNILHFHIFCTSFVL